MEVHLVADTNLFFECKALEDLPWGELGYDPVVVLLTKPVLDEIDKHKKANGRTRKRALEIFQRVRGMLKGSTTDPVIREASPRVVLRLVPNVAPDETHRDALDYSKNDDRLIGIAAALGRQSSDRDTVLFTDDTGPAAAADGLGVPYRMIDENWRRLAEESTETKRVRELEKDLATYRSQEPKISIGPCAPADESGTVTVTRRMASPLTEPEIEDALSALRSRHPMKTDFGLPASGRASSSVVHVEPPGDEDVRSYKEVVYPQWLDECRRILSELHVGRDEMESPVVLRWTMANDGTRPASRVSVQFEAQGPLEIRRVHEPDEGSAADTAGGDVAPASSAGPRPSLPRPPKPPAFKTTGPSFLGEHTPATERWRELSDKFAAGLAGDRFMGNAAASAARFDPLSGALKNIDRDGGVSRLLEQHRRMFEAAGPSVGKIAGFAVESIHLPHSLIPPKHDPEAFYYGAAADTPVKKLSLTCDLWRHQNGDEVFEFEVLFAKEGEARGSVLCTVHAENLTRPETARIVVRRGFEDFRPVELAREMVEKCH